MLIGKIIMLEELSKCNADLSDILMTSLWDTYCCDTHVLVWWAFSVCVCVCGCQYELKVWHQGKYPH